MRRVSLAARHERRQRNALRLSRGGLDAVGVVHAGVIQSQCRGNNVINRDPASYRHTSGRAKLPSASYRIGSSAGRPGLLPRAVPVPASLRSCRERRALLRVLGNGDGRVGPDGYDPV